MNCGKEHKKIACPNCGSKMKRARKDYPTYRFFIKKG
jgi:DNA-directed RNA polymerase subunit RPC12/RpoP